MGMGTGKARAWAVRVLAQNHNIELVCKGPDPSRPGPYGQRAGCVGWLAYQPVAARANDGGWWAERALAELAAVGTIECDAASWRLARVAEAAARHEGVSSPRPVLMVRVIEASDVTLASHCAWSALRGLEAAEVALERVPREAKYGMPASMAFVPEAPISNDPALAYIEEHASEDGEWQVRRYSGMSRVASWYDSDSGRRRRCNVGDLLLLATHQRPRVDQAPMRRRRSDADPYPVAAAVLSGIWQIRFVPAERS